MSNFAVLFKPLQIGSMEVKNRIGMAPMTSGYASEDGYVTQTLVDFYRKRAESGVGLITVESCYVERRGRGFPGHLSLEDDRFIPELKRLTEAVRNSGARLLLQLIHCGRQTTSVLCGEQPVAPSPIPCPVVREMPRELATEEIEEIVRKFARAASRAREAGFDGVELHAAHGYLLNQFLSPYSNRRSDRFGGDLYRRSALLLETLALCREKTGKDFILTCRLSADEFVSGGLTLKDTRQVAAWLQNAGLNAISVTGGVYESAHRIIPPMDVEPGSLLPLAQGIREAVNIPVFAVGGISDPAFADRILVQGKADLVLLGRALLADADWAAKSRTGKEGLIRPCIYCNHCRNRVVRPRINCAVNYETGREGRLTATARVEKPLNVVVVGGGPAGMQAACVSTMRGHHVTLFEKGRTLGGNLLLATLPPARERLRLIVTFLAEEIKRLGVPVHLMTEGSLERVREMNPDVVFLATGSTPILPVIPGIHGDNVHFAVDVLRQGLSVGRHAVIIGGGLVGLETADFLRERGIAVTLIEKLPTLESDVAVEAVFRKYLLSRLTRTDQPVLILTGTEVTGIGRNHVTVRQGSAEKTLPGADSVIIAAGFSPSLPFSPESLGSQCRVFVVGDAKTRGTLFEAIHSASETAWAL